jgi:hypothetical protein
MRTLFEYDVYFPVAGDNAVEVLVQAKHELTDYFGGLTDFRHRSEGTWKMGGVTFHDDIVLLRVLGEDRQAARSFLQRLSRRLATMLDQEEILIVEREVVALSS